MLNCDYFKAPTIHEFQKALRQAIQNAAISHRRSPVHAFLPGLFVGRFRPGEDPQTTIAQLKHRVEELERAAAQSAAEANSERIQRRVDAAASSAQLVAIFHQLVALPSPSLGVMEAASIKLRKFVLLDQAIDLLEKAREMWPGDAGLLRELGFCYRKRGPAGFERARQFFEEALRLNEGDPELHGMVGGMLKRMGRYDDAFEHYKRANDLLPRNLYALVNLGTIEAVRGRADAAASFYGDVLHHTDHVRSPADYWDLLCRGEAAVFLEQAGVAANAYNDALKCRPPVEDVRSASEQLAFFVTKNIQVPLAAELARILDAYIAANVPAIVRGGA